NTSSPVAENRLLLDWGTLIARDGKNLSNVFRQWISCGIRRVRNGEAEAAQIAALGVVPLPELVVLGEIERQQSAVRIRDRHRHTEHSFARLIAKSGSDIHSPRRLIFAVNGKSDRAGDAGLCALVLGVGRELRLRRIDVRRGTSDLNFGH